MRFIFDSCCKGIFRNLVFVPTTPEVYIKATTMIFNHGPSNYVSFLKEDDEHYYTIPVAWNWVDGWMHKFYSSASHHHYLWANDGIIVPTKIWERSEVGTLLANKARHVEKNVLVINMFHG
jgi:hypothetical protein